jgi:hypothetical protein
VKRWNFLALGLVLLLGRVALAQAPDAEGNARALAVYYDAEA